MREHGQHGYLPGTATGSTVFCRSTTLIRVTVYFVHIPYRQVPLHGVCFSQDKIQPCDNGDLQEGGSDKEMDPRTKALQDLKLLFGKEIEIRPDPTIQVTQHCSLHAVSNTGRGGEATGQVSQLSGSHADNILKRIGNITFCNHPFLPRLLFLFLILSGRLSSVLSLIASHTHTHTVSPQIQVLLLPSIPQTSVPHWYGLVTGTQE